MNRAVLLDRDGTLIVERNYLCDPDQVELEREVVPALARLHAAGFLLIVVTNQSGIGRGYYTEADFRSVQEELGRQLQGHGIPLAGDFHCPHHPTGGQGDFRRTCACRKPAPGMVLAAIERFDLDPSRCFMVGDTLKDVAAGQAAGMRGVLVRTGYGAELEREVGEVVPDHVADHLLDAVEDYILGAGGESEAPRVRAR